MRWKQAWRMWHFLRTNIEIIERFFAPGEVPKWNLAHLLWLPSDEGYQTAHFYLFYEPLSWEFLKPDGLFIWRQTAILCSPTRYMVENRLPSSSWPKICITRDLWTISWAFALIMNNNGWTVVWISNIWSSVCRRKEFTRTRCGNRAGRVSQLQPRQAKRFTNK